MLIAMDRHLGIDYGEIININAQLQGDEIYGNQHGLDGFQLYFSDGTNSKIQTLPSKPSSPLGYFILNDNEYI